MVSNSALAALCVKCGIHQLVDTRVYGVSKSFDAYVSAVTAALDGEQRASSREGRPPGQYWLQLQVPKACSLIPNVRNALTGVCPGTLGCHGGYTRGFVHLGQLHS